MKIRQKSVLFTMDSPSDSWAREMSRAAAGSLVEVPTTEDAESAWFIEYPGETPDARARRLLADFRPCLVDSLARAQLAPAPDWDFGFLSKLTPALGKIELRYDARIDSVLLMDDATAIGIVVPRRCVEEFGGILGAIKAGLEKVLEARGWPAERRLAIGGK